MLKYISALILSMSIFASCATAEAETVTTNTSTTTTTTPVTCDRACWEKIKQRQINERIYWAEVVKQQKAKAEAARIARIYAYAAAVERARIEALSGYCRIEGVRVCDGPGLLPYHIVWRESRFQGHTRNPRSTAGGYAQVLIGTFRYACPREAALYGNAAYAPISVQVECVRRLIAEFGLSPWR